MRVFVLTMLCKCKCLVQSAPLADVCGVWKTRLVFRHFSTMSTRWSCPHIVVNRLAIFLWDAVIIARFDCLRLHILLRSACMKYYNRKLFFFNNEQYKYWEKIFFSTRKGGDRPHRPPMDPPLAVSKGTLHGLPDADKAQDNPFWRSYGRVICELSDF